MRCPFCRSPDSRVIDSREVEDGQAIRRRRSCPECSRRFTTVEESLLSVVKRSGVTEPFSRSKVIAGVRRACQGRPVDADAVAQLAQQVEESVRGSGQAEVPSQEVGLAILGPLRDLDEVAYLRFASVYRSFTSADDFAAEIRDMAPPRGARPWPVGLHRPARHPGPRLRSDRPAAPNPAARCPTRSAARARRGRLTASRRGTTPALHHRTPSLGSTRPARHASTAPARPENATGEGTHDRDRRFSRDRRRSSGAGRPGPTRAVPTARGPACGWSGCTRRRRAPLRRGDLGAPRRRDDELARRLGQLRAARGGVPRLLVGERHQHRHQQVLPRRRRDPRAGVEPAADHRPGRHAVHHGGRRATATSPPRRTRRSSRTS